MELEEDVLDLKEKKRKFPSMGDLERISKFWRNLLECAKMLFQDKILLVFIWSVKYDNYPLLTLIFGVSFLRFIPNRFTDPVRSALSPSIISMIDSCDY